MEHAIKVLMTYPDMLATTPARTMGAWASHTAYIDMPIIIPFSDNRV